MRSRIDVFVLQKVILLVLCSSSLGATTSDSTEVCGPGAIAMGSSQLQITAKGAQRVQPAHDSEVHVSPIMSNVGNASLFELNEDLALNIGAQLAATFLKSAAGVELALASLEERMSPTTQELSDKIGHLVETQGASPVGCKSRLKRLKIKLKQLHDDVVTTASYLTETKKTVQVVDTQLKWTLTSIKKLETVKITKIKKCSTKKATDKMMLNKLMTDMREMRKMGKTVRTTRSRRVVRTSTTRRVSLLANTSSGVPVVGANRTNQVQNLFKNAKAASVEMHDCIQKHGSPSLLERGNTTSADEADDYYDDDDDDDDDDDIDSDVNDEIDDEATKQPVLAAAELQSDGSPPQHRQTREWPPPDPGAEQPQRQPQPTTREWPPRREDRMMTHHRDDVVVPPQPIVDPTRPGPIVDPGRPRPIVDPGRPRPIVDPEYPRPIVDPEYPRPIVDPERPRPIVDPPRPRPIVDPPRPRPIVDPPRPRPIVDPPRPRPIVDPPRPRPIGTTRPAPIVDEPEHCKIEREQLEESWEVAYEEITREVESYEVLVDDTSCVDSEESEYQEKFQPLQVQETELSRKVSIAISKVQTLRPQLQSLKLARKELEKRLLIITQECEAVEKTKETLEVTKEVIIKMDECAGLDSSAFDLPVWVGEWITVDLSEDLAITDADARMNQACAQTFGGRVRAAEVSEIDTGGVRQMPKRNRASVPMMPTCPMCGTKFARVCWDPGAKLNHKRRRADCTPGTRAIMCVKPGSDEGPSTRPATRPARRDRRDRRQRRQRRQRRN